MAVIVAKLETDGPGLSFTEHLFTVNCKAKKQKYS